jgi:hypothetical protein
MSFAAILNYFFNYFWHLVVLVSGHWFYKHEGLSCESRKEELHSRSMGVSFDIPSDNNG